MLLRSSDLARLSKRREPYAKPFNSRSDRQHECAGAEDHIRPSAHLLRLGLGRHLKAPIDPVFAGCLSTVMRGGSEHQLHYAPSGGIDQRQIRRM